MKVDEVLSSGSASPYRTARGALPMTTKPTTRNVPIRNQQLPGPG